MFVVTLADAGEFSAAPQSFNPRGMVGLLDSLQVIYVVRECFAMAIYSSDEFTQCRRYFILTDSPV
ncbi:MAG: hypothetical protein ACI9WS_002377 [Paraglaciecola psychrophila]